MNTNKLLNALTGRTKKLKENVRLERNKRLIYRIKDNLCEMFFKSHPLEEEKRMDFFFFCTDDPYYEARCAGKSEIAIYKFLNERYQEYLANLQSKN